MEMEWDKLNKDVTPGLKDVSRWVDTPRWDGFIADMEATYKTQPRLEYSGCGMMSGWNLKFKKGGKGLCTLYPEAGYFTVLVVIGQKEKAEAELALPTFTEYTQKLYARTKEGMGQRWLMFEVRDDAVLEDIKRCIAIRRQAG